MAMIKKMKKQNTNLNKNQIEVSKILELPLEKRIKLYKKANDWVNDYHSKVAGKDTRTAECVAILNETPENIRDLYMSCILAELQDKEV